MLRSSLTGARLSASSGSLPATGWSSISGSREPTKSPSTTARRVSSGRMTSWMWTVSAAFHGAKALCISEVELRGEGRRGLLSAVAAGLGQAARVHTWTALSADMKPISALGQATT